MSVAFSKSLTSALTCYLLLWYCAAHVIICPVIKAQTKQFKNAQNKFKLHVNVGCLISLMETEGLYVVRIWRLLSGVQNKTVKHSSLISEDSELLEAKHGMRWMWKGRLRDGKKRTKVTKKFSTSSRYIKQVLSNIFTVLCAHSALGEHQLEIHTNVVITHAGIT